MNKKFSLETIDIIFIIILLTISTIIKIQTYPDGIAIDEANHWAEVRHHKILEVYTGNYNSPMPESPLFFYINYLMIRIKNDLLIFRIPQILFSYATIILFYIFAKTFFNRYIAFLASLILITSRAFNLISAYVNPHIYQCFFALATLMNLMLAIQKNNRKNLILAFAFAALAYLISPMGVITTAALIISLIITKNDFIRINNKEKNKIKISKELVIAIIVFFAIILILAPSKILKGKMFTEYLKKQNFIKSEKTERSIPFFSSLLLGSIWYEHLCLSKIFVVVGVLTMILTLSKKQFLPITIYMITYAFIMSFTLGGMAYTVSIVMFLYMFFSEGAFISINRVLLFIHKSLSEKESEKEAKKISFYSKIVSFTILTVFIITTYIYESSKNVFDMNGALKHTMNKKAYEYIKSRNKSGMYMLIEDFQCSMEYYVDKDKLNITIIPLPNKLEIAYEVLPPEHPYYDYVITTKEEVWDKNSLRYATLQKIAEQCTLESEILYTNGRMFGLNIFNCENVTIKTKN
ncbi:MAG: glycosyltransferase family 39 protein [Candidatus Woesearchaeota archaeon]